VGLEAQYPIHDDDDNKWFHSDGETDGETDGDCDDDDNHGYHSCS
jgi:hypothetical protein